ncbi:MAG: glycosyltransferase [Porcipelethomonas sp.]
MYSVLMSVYKKELPENLRESVESMMNQTVPPGDFVLYCDGRLTDELYLETERLKQRYPVLNVIYDNVNRGLGKALAAGLDHCKNDIVARMDSDDIAKPERMALQLAAFKKYGADIVSGTVEEFSGDISNITGIKELPETDSEIKIYARRRNPFNHPCVCFRKQQVYMAGGYEHCPYFEDYWLWVRMLLNGCKGYNVRESVLYMRSGSELYKRRGGLSYTADALRFRKKMRAAGGCGRTDFITACAAHIAFGIIPNKMRMFLYSKILRK